MNDEIRKRDILWCMALVATLDIKDVAKVLADFNTIRPDLGEAVEHTLAPDGAYALAKRRSPRNDSERFRHGFRVSAPQVKQTLASP